MKTHHFPITRMARYALSGPITEETCDLLIGLHGYGQLAPVFAEQLKPVVVPGREVVCPEGLSRYYTNHKERVAGASWMTSEDREYEILDHVAWLDALAENLLEDAPEHLFVRVLGFSQGAPAASRWVGNGQLDVHQLILWGAPQAHDLTDEEWACLAAVPDVVLVAGRDDTIFPKNRVEVALDALEARGCHARHHFHDGGHVVLSDVLETVLQAPAPNP